MSKADRDYLIELVEKDMTDMLMGSKHLRLFSKSQLLDRMVLARLLLRELFDENNK